jgi:DNA polymerase elongation subunit (family B)
LYNVEGELFNFPLKVPAIKAAKIEQVSEEPIQDLKILAVDIETYHPTGSPVSITDSPIIMLGLHSYKFNKVLTWKHFKTENHDIEFVKSEADLLQRFVEIVNQQAPDIITGYFSDGFDMPIIAERARKYKIDLNVGLDYSELKVSGRQIKTAQITGITHIDILRFAKNTLRNSLKTGSYSLNAVAQELLGQKKQEVNIEELFDIWDNKPEKLV